MQQAGIRNYSKRIQRKKVEAGEGKNLYKSTMIQNSDDEAQYAWLVWISLFVKVMHHPQYLWAIILTCACKQKPIIIKSD